MPGQVLSMGKLGWQPRSAVIELRKADAEGMGARAVFEPRLAGLPMTLLIELAGMKDVCGPAPRIGRLLVELETTYRSLSPTASPF